jgi:hypothetical protein
MKPFVCNRVETSTLSCFGYELKKARLAPFFIAARESFANQNPRRFQQNITDHQPLRIPKYTHELFISTLYETDYTAVGVRIMHALL